MIAASAIGGLIADFASRPFVDLYRERGVPSLEGGFVELPYFSEVQNAVFGGRSNEKQPHESRFVYLEVAGPIQV